MSPRPQSGPHASPLASPGHLDADTLSAFLEGALPEPERLASLRHLAGCSGCRELAFLAQPADPAFAASPSAAQTSTQQPVAAPRSGRWSLRSLGLPRSRWSHSAAWSGLSLAALTCAVLAVVFVQVHTHSKPRTPAQPASSTAARPGSSPTPQVVARANPGEPPHNTPAAPGSVPPHHHRPAQTTPAALQPPPETLQINAFNAALKQKPVAGTAHSAAPKVLPQASPAATVAAAPPAKRTASPTATAELRQSMPGYLSPAAPAPAPPPPAAPVSSSGAVVALPQSARAAQAAPPPAAPASLAAKAAPAGPPPAPPTSVSETVEVSAAALVPLTDAQNSTSAELTVTAPPHLSPLPSHQLTAASAALPGHRVALDVAGTLFASRDDGRHWKRIKPRWPGAIQSLTLTPGSYFQIVTTAGETWTSTDGQHWKNHEPRSRRAIVLP